MACLVNDFASFDTPEDPGGASIMERKDFQAKRPLCPGSYGPDRVLLCKPLLNNVVKDFIKLHFNFVIVLQFNDIFMCKAKILLLHR